MRVSNQSARQDAKHEEEKILNIGRDGLGLKRQLFEIIVKTRIIELLLIQKGILKERDLDSCLRR
jgi:hypothetical protein